MAEERAGRKRIVVLVALVAIVAVAVVFFSSHRSDNGMIVTSGIVDGIETNLSSKIAGRISEVCCRESEQVAAGQVAVRLLSAELEANVLQAEAAVRRARAEVSAAASGVRSAEAAAGSAAADVLSASAERVRAEAEETDRKASAERAKALFAKGFISREEMDRAATSHATSVAVVEAARAGIQAARAREAAARAQTDTAAGLLASTRAALAEAEANLASARARFDDTVITAPQAGTVVFRAFEPGEHVTPGSAILTIVDMEHLYVRVDLEETRIAALHLGADASISIPSAPKTRLNGKIIEIGRYAEFATQRDVTRGRQDIKTFRVKIRAEDPKQLLKPGMTVTVEIPVR